MSHDTSRENQPGQSKALKFEWEEIEYCTMRAKVAGGWVLLVDTVPAKTMVFIPDPEHSWIVET